MGFIEGDEYRLLTAGQDGTLRMWNDSTLEAVVPTRDVSSNGVVAVAPEQRIAVLGSLDGTVTLVNVDTGEHCALDEGQPVERHAVSSVAFSPDRTMLAAGHDNGTIILWTPGGSRSRISHPTPTNRRLRSLAFSPDSRWLASGSDDGGIALWDAMSPSSDAIATTRTGAVWALAFSADGRLLVSGTGLGELRRWSVPELAHVGDQLAGHAGGINSLAVARADGGTLLASAGDDGTVRLWQWPDMSRWVHRACDIANRWLTAEELAGSAVGLERTVCPSSPREAEHVRTPGTGTAHPVTRVASRHSSVEWATYKTLCQRK
jgi:WD40 repeat protein